MRLTISMDIGTCGWNISMDIGTCGWLFPWTLEHAVDHFHGHWNMRLTISMDIGTCGWSFPWTLEHAVDHFHGHWNMRLIISMDIGTCGWSFPWTLEHAVDHFHGHWNMWLKYFRRHDTCKTRGLKLDSFICMVYLLIACWGRVAGSWTHSHSPRVGVWVALCLLVNEGWVAAPSSPHPSPCIRYRGEGRLGYWLAASQASIQSL